MPNVPGYELTELVHRGSGYEVYRAWDLADGKAVVVKIVPEAASPEAYALLKRDHDVRCELDLDCVVRTHDLIRHHRAVALIAEPFAGPSLRDMIAESPLSLEQALGLGAAAARALAGLHRAGFVHNRIHPESILFDSDTWQVKLVNFGSCQTAEKSAAGELDSDFSLDLRYISPEQSGRMNRVVDSRSDLYSLGVTLYELLAGRTPFQNEDPLELVHAHLAVTPRPLQTVDARIPEPVSKILEKLLAKSPDDRYQTAEGLAADLETCLGRLRDSGRIDALELGIHDMPTGFQPLDKLFGREGPRRQLHAALERVGDGGIEVMVLSGAAGMGKSALARAVGASAGPARGLCGAGRFERSGHRPFGGLAEALEQLIQQLLTHNEWELDGWRQRILEAVQENGRLIADVLPSLELVIGPQPESKPLQPVEAENRFRRTFVSFMEVFCKRAHPLVLLLDDLQWADAASLQLIAALPSSPNIEALLLIACHDGDADDGGGRLRKALDGLRGKGVPVGLLKLEALTLEDTTQMVAETLRNRIADGASLAEIVWRKTGGNPLFVNRFLRVLFESSLIEYDASIKSFRAKLTEIEAMQITDNVAEALVKRFSRLPDTAAAALGVAAMIGSRFSIDAVAHVLDSDPEDVSAALGYAVAENVIVPHVAPAAHQAEPSRAPPRDDRFAFVHVRLQEFADSLVADEDRPEIHLAIGRWLRDHAPKTPGEDRTFETATQLNAGASMISDEAERSALFDLDLAAAAKARASTSYTVAIPFLRSAVELLGADAWQTQRPRIYEAQLQLAECSSLAGHFQDALSMLDEALSHCADRAERTELLTAQVGVHTARGDLLAAVDCGVEAVREVGVTVPEQGEALEQQLDTEIAAILDALEQGGIERFRALPDMRDPEKMALATLLAQMIPALYQTDARRFALVCCKIVTLSLEHGNCAVSAKAYGALTVIFSGMLGRYGDSHRFGELGVDLTDRLGDLAGSAAAYFLWAMFGSAWTRPMHESLELYRRSMECGLKYGDHPHAAYSAARMITHETFMGLPVDQLRRDAEANLSLLEQLEDRVSPPVLMQRIQLFKWLQGELPDPASLSDAAFDEDRHAERVLETQNRSRISHLAIVRMMHRYLQRDYPSALEFGRESRASLAGSTGTITLAEHVFYYSLALAACYPEASESERREFDALLDEHEQQLGVWAESCPENFRPHQLLVAAERARVAGDSWGALLRYDEAIGAADLHRFPNVEALACELCGNFWTNLGKDWLADVYLRRARSAYQAWGAAQKLRQLEDVSAASDADTDAEDADEEGSRSLDIAAVLKASRAMSGEIVMEHLLRTLMDIVLETAGAQFGSLVLAESGGLAVQAARAPDAETTEVMCAIPLADAEHVSAGIVNYVTRTKETLVLDDAAASAFESDAYVDRERPKSVLCAPIVHQGKLVGALYVENRLTTGAFTPNRVEALSILMSQVAVSIQNASLFSIQEQQTRELEQYRDHLEDLVKERTSELESAHRRLMDLSRKAGMAEVASGVLHNVGNVLNSVSVGASTVKERIKAMRFDGMTKLAGLFAEHGDDLSRFTADDPRARKIPQYVRELDGRLTDDRNDLLSSIDRLAEHLEHMKSIIAQQQSYSRVATVTEQCLLQSVFEAALEICNASLVNRSIRIEREFEELPPVTVDRHQVLQILVNLISNAKHALAAKPDGERVITLGLARGEGDHVRLTVADNGMGIKPEHMNQIFVHGFTTKKDGHGFGLHNCANAAQQMGGQLQAQSDGEGRGAVFTLSIPAAAGASAPDREMAAARAGHGA